MADEDDGDDEMHRAMALGIGVIGTLIGVWLALNGGGTCLGLRFTDFCLIGGQTFGLLVTIFGLLFLWGGYDAYKQGEKTI